ncbi:MAG: hypothetical protein GKC06_02630 [Methanomicrobiales archaeon]|nr:hypothetical protein [Methanomicrobiales archaeon]
MSSRNHTASPVCRVCGQSESESGHEHPAGVCRGCLFKIGIVLIIVMVITSYVVWFGLL